MATEDAAPAVTGDDVRRAREERNLTRAQLADHVGSSEGTIKQLENRGATPVPTNSRFVPVILRLLDLDSTPASDERGLLPADVVERALRQADDVALMAETSRRLAYSRDVRHDQRNVAAFEIRGMPESDSTTGGTNDPSA